MVDAGLIVSELDRAREVVAGLSPAERAELVLEFKAHRAASDVLESLAAVHERDLRDAEVRLEGGEPRASGELRTPAERVVAHDQMHNMVARTFLRGELAQAFSAPVADRRARVQAVLEAERVRMRVQDASRAVRLRAAGGVVT